MLNTQNQKFQWRINSYLGILFAVMLFIGINALSKMHYYQADFTINKLSQLSQLSLDLVADLPDALQIIVFEDEQHKYLPPIITQEIDYLLQSYAYASHGKITLKHVNPYIDLREAETIKEKYKLAEDENVLILAYKERFRVIPIKDLVELEKNSILQGGQPPRVKAFKGEVILTSSIHGLTRSEKSKIYFISGHGEYDPNSESLNGYSKLRSYMLRQHAEVLSLNLAATGTIPEDASLVIIAGPRKPFLDFETSLLSEYLTRSGDRPGRLLLMLDPATTSGLENLLSPYGITFQDDLAISRILVAGKTDILAQAIATDFAPSHPAMKWAQTIRGNFVLGMTRTLTVQHMPEREETLTKLLQTPTSFWGERDYQTDPQTFDENKETIGPLTLAASIDAGNVSGGEVRLDKMKAVAIGCASFLNNKAISEEKLDFFLNLTNWMLGQDKLLGIQPKIPKDLHFDITDEQKINLLLSVGGTLALCGIAGIFVWLQKRR